MIRTLLRRVLGPKGGIFWSKRVNSVLLWPTWAVFDVDDPLDHIAVQQITNIMRWHSQLGIRDFILSSSNLFGTSEVVRLVQHCWSAGYRVWLATETSPLNSEPLIEAARSGATGIAFLATSPDTVGNLEPFVDAHHRCPGTDFRAVISIDPNVPSLGLTLVESVLRQNLALDIDLGTGEINAISSHLESMELIRESLDPSDIGTNWPLLATRGCSCAEPLSGWYIDKSYAARFCRERAAIGDLTKNRVRHSWLSPNALRQLQTSCVRYSGLRGSVWRKPAQKIVPTLSVEPQSTVTVIVPSYGRPAERVVSTLDALLQQDYEKGKYNIILVDDGNSSTAAEQAVKMCSDPARVKYLRVPHGGAASARNHGIHAATGDIVAFTDDDCEPTSSWLRELAISFTDERVGGVGGLTVPISLKNMIVRFIDHRRALRRFLTDKDIESPDILPTANAAYRRSTLEEIGGFSKAFAQAGLRYGGEDRYLTWRVIQAGYQIKINLYARVYHQHRDSLWQLIEQGYQYGCGCYLHCRLTGLPYDYEPRLTTQLSIFTEYLWPYFYWVRRYYLKGAKMSDAFIFPLLDFLRRSASAWGSYITHRRLKNSLDFVIQTDG